MLAHIKPAIHQYQVSSTISKPFRTICQNSFFLVNFKFKMLPGPEKLVQLQQSELAEHSSFKAITITTDILISNIHAHKYDPLSPTFPSHARKPTGIAEYDSPSRGQ